MPTKRKIGKRKKIIVRATTTRTRHRQTARKTNRRPAKHLPSPRAVIPYLCIVLGLLLLGYWGAHKLLTYRSLTMASHILDTYGTGRVRGNLPQFIRVGDTIALPVTEAGFVGGVWTISETDANHVPQSGAPGEGKNIIVYAHNRKDLFGPLRTVAMGDVVTIRTADGLLHSYRVTEIAEVPPTDTRLLLPTVSEVLTLYTCSGFLDSKRFVVRAAPLDLQ